MLRTRRGGQHVALGDYLFHRRIGCRGIRILGNRDGGGRDRANFVFLVPGVVPDLACRRIDASGMTAVSIQSPLGAVAFLSFTEGK